MKAISGLSSLPTSIVNLRRGKSAVEFAQNFPARQLVGTAVWGSGGGGGRQGGMRGLVVWGGGIQPISPFSTYPPTVEGYTDVEDAYIFFCRLFWLKPPSVVPLACIGSPLLPTKR